ncbi:MAG TPA: aminoglycoside phosphotransferase family protein [Acidimicrobiales bacterium]
MRNGASTRSGLELARAKFALEAAGMNPHVDLTRASSVTNEVWLSDEHAIRVNRRPDKRLWREAKLGPHLPPEVRYPEIVGYGTGVGFDWLVARRRPGTVLSRCWPTMAPAQQRLAVRQLAFMLRALHASPAPGGLGDVNELGAPQLLYTGQGMVPVTPLLAALSHASTLAHVDPQPMRELAALVKTSAPVIEPFDVRTLVHGDLTFENVLWDGEQVTALIDFEWARPAPPDLELDVFLRCCAYPFLHVADDYAEQTRAEAYEEVPSWLAEDYPQLFASPRLVDRLRIYAVAFEVRQLLTDPPTAPAAELSPHHPLRRLLRLLTKRSYLDI